MVSIQQNENKAERLAALLREAPVFCEAPTAELARLVSFTRAVDVKAGELLINKGTPANTVYLVESGCFDIQPKCDIRDRKAVVLGIETALGMNCYEHRQVAIEDSRVIAIPGHCIEKLVEKTPRLRDAFVRLYAGVYQTIELSPSCADPAGGLIEVETDTRCGKTALSWLVVIVLPFVVFSAGKQFGLTQEGSVFFGIATITVFMWMFQLLPAFVPPFLSVLLIILFDVVPPRVALSGFSSPTFFMCLSIFGISGLLVSSGLTYRITLHILRKVPPTRTWYSSTILLLGVFLTPIVPSLTARASILLPFLIELLQISKVGNNDSRATQLVISTLYGTFIVSSCFLTGRPLNLMVFGMFDQQTQYSFGWIYWLYSASVVGFLLFVTYFIVSAIIFRKAGKIEVPRWSIDTQLKLLGPMTKVEWAALTSICVMGLGIVTSAIHQIDIPWLVLTIIITLLIFGTLGGEEVRTEIDWTTLILMGSVMAWVPIISHTGIDLFIIDKVGWIGVYMTENLYLFIALLYLCILIVMLLLPSEITALLFITAFFPIASSVGISPWFIAFLILIMTESFLFPYQFDEYMFIRNTLSYYGFGSTYNNTRIIQFNGVMLVLRIGIIYASIPFWQYLRIL